MKRWLRVTMTPPGDQPIVRSGYTLTIFRKNLDGRWLMTRDASLLAPETKT
jgi:ketosteroid isomerase-like protein